MDTTRESTTAPAEIAAPAAPAAPAEAAEAAEAAKEPVRMHRMVSALAWDVGPSVAAYYGARALGCSDYVSLLAGTVASALRLIWVAVRDRRVDAFAMFLMVLFGVGLALTFVTGDARFVLIKDSLTSFLAGLFFVGSCALRRPLTYYAAQRFAGTQRAKADRDLVLDWAANSVRGVFEAALLAPVIRVGVEHPGQARNPPIRRSARDQGIMFASEEHDGLIRAEAHRAFEGQQRHPAFAPGFAALLLPEACIGFAAALAGHHPAAPLQVFRRLDLRRRKELQHAAIDENAHASLAIDELKLWQILKEGP